MPDLHGDKETVFSEELFFAINFKLFYIYTLKICIKTDWNVNSASKSYFLLKAGLRCLQ